MNEKESTFGLAEKLALLLLLSAIVTGFSMDRKWISHDWVVYMWACAILGFLFTLSFVAKWINEKSKQVRESSVFKKLDRVRAWIADQEPDDKAR